MLYFPCSENKGADQLCGNREADLFLFLAYAKFWFSHNETHFKNEFTRNEQCQIVINFLLKSMSSVFPGVRKVPV